MTTESKVKIRGPGDSGDLLPVGGEFRMTPQRREVFEVLKSREDHPSASEIFQQVKQRMPTISLATVYNCLEAMTQHGLVKQVNLDREPSRYCANLREHAHFFCQNCGEVSDIDAVALSNVAQAFAIPDGSRVDRFDVTIRGRCPVCSESSGKAVASPASPSV